MKKLILLVTLTLLSCSKVELQTSEETTICSSYDYDYFASRTIDFNNIFNFDYDYEVYIFSKSCRHCENIKDLVLSYALLNNDLYFVEFSNSIPLTNDISSTIGVDRYEDVYILGTPTLLVIKSKVLTANIAGEKNITNYIET